MNLTRDGMRSWLIVITLVSGLTACSSAPQQPQRLADFENLEPALLTNTTKHSKTNADATSDSIAVSTPTFSAKQMIQRYQAILEVHDDPATIAKVERRIADLRMLAMEEEQFSDNGEQKADNKRSSVEANTATTSYQAIIAHYQRILAATPNTAANENTLYQLAKAYDYEGQSTQSLATLNRLIQEHPDTQYYDEVHYRRGDIYYALKQYPQAYQSYNKLIAKTEGSYYLNALYMQGWTLFKQGQYQPASMKFSQVLDNTLKAHALSAVENKQKAIVDDSLRILAVIFSYQDYGHSIAALYQQLGNRAYESILYRQLSDLLLTRDLKIQAIETNNTFIQHYPLHAEAPRFFQRNIAIYQHSNEVLNVRRSKDEYIARFGPNSDYWQQATPALKASLKPQLHNYLLEMASFHHALAQSLNKRQLKAKHKQGSKANSQADAAIDKEFELAISHYNQWISLFPQHQELPDKAFLLAQAYQENKQFKQAIYWYDHVAYHLDNNVHAEAAAYASTVNYQRLLNGLTETQQQIQTNNEQTLQTLQQQQQQPINSEWRYLALKKIHSQQRFQWYFPDSRKQQAMAINAMQSQYQLRNYHATIQQSELILANANTLESTQTYQAWLLLAHSHYLMQNYYAAEQGYSKALLAASTPKEQTLLKERIANSVYQQAEYALAQKQMTFALLNLHRMPYVTEEPEYLLKAHYDEATYLLISKRWQEAISSLKLFRKNYPQHPFTREIPAKLIAAYEGAGDWGHAADELKIVYRNSDDKEKQRLALYLAAEYYEKAELHDAALENYRAYAHQFPEPFDLNLETQFKLSETYKVKGDIEKREYWLQKLIKAEQSTSNERSRFLAAMASRYFADQLYPTFSNIELKQPLDISLKSKQAAFDRLLSAYKRIDDYESSFYSSYARYQIAHIYDELARSLLTSERPQGFNEIELEEYQYMLEDEAYPFEENAIALHTSNTELAQQDIFNEWVEKSFNALTKLFPARYNKPERLSINHERIH